MGLVLTPEQPPPRVVGKGNQKGLKREMGPIRRKIPLVNGKKGEE